MPRWRSPARCRRPPEPGAGSRGATARLSRHQFRDLLQQQTTCNFGIAGPSLCSSPGLCSSPAGAPRAARAARNCQTLVLKYHHALKRASMSKQEEKVNILIRFRIFHLCNGRPVMQHSHAHTSGTFGRANVTLCGRNAKDKKQQLESEHSIFALESLVRILRRTLSECTMTHNALPVGHCIQCGNVLEKY